VHAISRLIPANVSNKLAFISLSIFLSVSEEQLPQLSYRHVVQMLSENPGLANSTRKDLFAEFFWWQADLAKSYYLSDPIYLLFANFDQLNISTPPFLGFSTFRSSSEENFCCTL
jgi:hypothetical protein